MRFLKKISLYFTIIIHFLVLSNCNHSVNKKNYEIPTEIRSEIWKLNSDFYVSIIESDYNTALKYYSDSVYKTIEDLNHDSLFYSLKYGLFEFEYSAQDIFYSKNLFKGTIVEARFNDIEFNPFLIRYKAYIKESFVTIAFLENSDIRYALITFVGGYNYEWKIDHVYLGLYTIQGKDAIDWLKDAEDHLRKGNYVLAKYSIIMVELLINPIEDIWFYENKEFLLERMKNVNKSLNRNFKLKSVFKNIDTKPKLDDIYPAMVHKKIYPAITYETSISLNDSLRINKECQKLDESIRGLFSNFNNDSLYIRIIPKTDPWEQPHSEYIIKRKILK